MSASRNGCAAREGGRVAAGLRYGVEIRAAQPADGPEIARLLGLAPPALASRLEAVRAHAGSAVLVATGYGGLSGCVALNWAPSLLQPRAAATLNVLVVDPEERRHGIGRLLLKAASQAARSAGCDSLDTLAPSATDGAAFLQASGFVQAGAGFSRSLRKRQE